jgi:hypothetical protein
MNLDTQIAVSRMRYDELLQEAARERLVKQARLGLPEGQRALGHTALRYARYALASLAALGIQL